MKKLHANPDRNSRDSVYRLSDWWRPEIVKNAKVAVFGAGALGNEVLKNLALVGIGNIYIVDFDIIQRVNLSRSVLFREIHEGKSKSKIACQSIHELNPYIKAKWFHGDIRHHIGLGIIRRMDVIVSCVDNNDARLFINRACWRTNKPWLDGGLNSIDGDVRVFWPGRGACFECTLSKYAYEELNQRKSCQQLEFKIEDEERIPTTPTAASIVGAIQTQEVLKILHGFDVPAGKILNFFGITGEFEWLTLKKRADCPSHTVFEPIIEIPQVSVRETSVANFAEIIRHSIGSDALIELGFWFVISWSCSICGKREDILKPVFQLTYEESICCGEERTLDVVSHFSGHESFADLTLSQIGIPPVEILRVNSGGMYHYVELSGDSINNQFIS